MMTTEDDAPGTTAADVRAALARHRVRLYRIAHLIPLHPARLSRLLNEHERRFGNGLLAEERIAARIQALCALGRTTEADAQLARLSPKSLHGEPARQACSSRK